MPVAVYPPIRTAKPVRRTGICSRNKDVFDTTSKLGSELKGKRQGRVVAAFLDADDGLAGDAQGIGKLLLRQPMFLPQLTKMVVHGLGLAPLAKKVRDTEHYGKKDAQHDRRGAERNAGIHKHGRHPHDAHGPQQRMDRILRR